MSTLSDNSTAPLRWSVYGLLIVISVGAMTGRIWAVNSVDKIALEKHLQGQGRGDWQQQRPFLSANDRSRWLTVRALVEHGTYAIDDIVWQPGWDTIDMVKHDGHLYSSKPTLLPTLMAGEYWLIHQLTGATLGTHPYEIGRCMLITMNVIPLAVYFVILARLVERFGTTDWGRLFVMAAAVLGTFLTTFAIVINNHAVAAISVLLAVAAAAPIWCAGERRWRYFAAAGLFAAFAAANELPALSFFGLLTLGLLWKAPVRTLIAYLPAALLVAAAAVGTNYLAHGSLRTPYAHRGDGKLLFSIDSDHRGQLDRGQLPAAVRRQFAEDGIELSPNTVAYVDTVNPGWIVSDQVDDPRYVVRPASGGLNVHVWDNWYDYTYLRGGKVRESYWRATSARSPIDQGQPSRWVYAVNVLVGHHGIFSLTPIWLLSIVGGWLAWRGRLVGLRELAVMTAILTLVCLAFYLRQPQIDRNYGGSTSGLRWMFWFAPLWLLLILPAADAGSACRWVRGLCLVLLGWSVMSASYPTWNPWTHPWILNLTNYLGWTKL